MLVGTASRGVAARTSSFHFSICNRRLGRPDIALSSDDFENSRTPGNHRYLASCIYKIIRWQCRHASCRLRASGQTLRAWRMPAIHGAPHSTSRKGGSQLPVSFKPYVILSILEIDPCQRIPVEKPAD
ncbi:MULTISPECIES: hypothetical protein [Burkholderia]|uniref:hypothetical protein n=1 Tax=Burkholderia TaxID=32008 RepID=UPI001E6367B5|nr:MULTISPECIES: hypothetical protein [Burkholderia]